MSFIAIAKEVAKRAVASAHEHTQPKRPSQDENLPYGGKIGSLAQIQDVAFLTATMFGSIILPPKTGEVTIRAISRLRFDGWSETTGVYRFYLAKGDQSDEQERYLQIMTENGTPKEVLYFSSLCRLIPEDKSMIEYYQGIGDDRIGGRLWEFGKEDLKNLLNQKQLKTLGDAPGLVYDREIGTGEFLPPLHGYENRIDDPFGDKGIRQEIWAMPYVRTLQEGVDEKLFISLENVKKHDGKVEGDVHVDFMIGISIPVNDFRII